MSGDLRSFYSDIGTEIIWGGDHTYEDFAIDDEDGIVSNYTCPNDDCQVELIEIYNAI